jgi:hypothetical protein
VKQTMDGILGLADKEIASPIVEFFPFLKKIILSLASSFVGTGVGNSFDFRSQRFTPPPITNVLVIIEKSAWAN